MHNSSNLTNIHTISLDAILLGAMYSVIVLFGSIGNALVVLVVWRTPSMHTTTNYLLSSLACADLLTLVWCPGVYDYALSNVQLQKVTGDYICKFFTGNAIQAVTINVSAITLTLIAVERYNALVRPMVTEARFNKKNVRYAIALTWIIGVVSCIPDFMYISYSKTMGKCSRPWTLDQAHRRKTHIITTTVFLILIPLLIMSYCYLQIMKGLYLTKTVFSQAVASQDFKQEKKNLAKLLLSVTIVFYICCLPFGIFMIYVVCMEPLGKEQMERGPLNTAHGVVRFLLFANSSFNPFLYAWQSSNYREGFKRFAKCDCKMERTRYLICTVPIEKNPKSPEDYV